MKLGDSIYLLIGALELGHDLAQKCRLTARNL